MTKARHVAAVALVLLTVTACGHGAPPPPGVVVHKEYVPASLSDLEEGRTLRRQCWRIDVEQQKQYAPQGVTHVISHCVFPSEFNALNVGDTYTAPKITY